MTKYFFKKKAIKMIFKWKRFQNKNYKNTFLNKIVNIYLLIPNFEEKKNLVGVTFQIKKYM